MISCLIVVNASSHAMVHSTQKQKANTDMPKGHLLAMSPVGGLPSTLPQNFIVVSCEENISWEVDSGLELVI